MNRQSRIKLALLASVGCVTIALVGCHQGADADDAHAAHAHGRKAGGKQAPQDTAEAADGVVLTPDEVGKMGIATTPAEAAMHTPEAAGYATVVAHDSIAQALAELETAAAVERQSRAALDRGRRLAGTPGAMPLETQEGAQRQAVVDQAALQLAKRRLSSTPASREKAFLPCCRAVTSARASG